MKTTLTIASAALMVLATSAMSQENGLNEGHLSALDKDGDASISSAEFGNFANFAFQSMDADKSGTLSPNEVAPHAPAGAFERTDADGNGTVTRSEYDNRMNTIFSEADKDGDGQLN